MKILDFVGFDKAIKEVLTAATRVVPWHLPGTRATIVWSGASATASVHKPGTLIENSWLSLSRCNTSGSSTTNSAWIDLMFVDMPVQPGAGSKFVVGFRVKKGRSYTSLTNYYNRTPTAVDYAHVVNMFAIHHTGGVTPTLLSSADFQQWITDVEHYFEFVIDTTTSEVVIYRDQVLLATRSFTYTGQITGVRILNSSANGTTGNWELFFKDIYIGEIQVGQPVTRLGSVIVTALPLATAEVWPTEPNGLVSRDVLDDVRPLANDAAASTFALVDEAGGAVTFNHTQLHPKERILAVQYNVDTLSTPEHSTLGAELKKSNAVVEQVNRSFTAAYNKTGPVANSNYYKSLFMKQFDDGIGPVALDEYTLRLQAGPVS